MKLLKLKLGGAGDPQRMAAVRAARPDARLVADANEAWTAEMLAPFLDAAARFGLELIEQPLPEGADETLAHVPHAVPICADESAHTSADLDRLASRYDAVNIKLDKTGGLTEALAMARSAKARGLKIMVGSMVATSLAGARRCCSPMTPIGSISTARCCSRATASPASQSRMASSARRLQSCGARSRQIRLAPHDAAAPFLHEHESCRQPNKRHGRGHEIDAAAEGLIESA